MGFECGFLSLNKHKDTTVEEAIKLSRAHDTDESVDLDDRLEKLMSYYKFHPEGEYGELPLTVNHWCSGGYKYLDEFITSHLNPYDENSYTGIDKNFIEKGISWAAQELCKIQLKPVQVLKAYKDENKKIETLMSCDGLEVLDENGNRKFVNISKDYIFIADGEYDEDRQYVLESFIETLKLIEKMDLENNLLWYFRGW